MLPKSTIPVATARYDQYPDRLQRVRSRFNRPLTLTEKVVYSHLVSIEHQEIERGKSILQLKPDRLIMQDATAQMALLQFMTSGKKTVDLPASVHCDHLIIGQKGAAADTAEAKIVNKEVYNFLLTVCQKYGIDFWGPGSGIIHQVFLENYAFPGGLIIGTDSHTPNAGGLGMIAVGVGGADAVDVMVGLPWEVLCPKLVGVRLKGKLNGWTSPKDVILKLCGILTCAGGTNKIIEYFGEGAREISATGKGTITNMGAELGATTSIFPYDAHSELYLRATGRATIADRAKPLVSDFSADPEVEKRPENFFDEVIEIDLSTLEPHVVGPHSPDIANPVSAVKAHVEKNQYPADIRVALIGSCTNSSYEDIGRAAQVAEQAVQKKVPLRTKLLVTPGSQTVYSTAERDGLLKPLIALGAEVLANACGPCIGQWSRSDIKKDEVNSILTSFNRNFPKRNDGNANTLAFIASPEVVVAYACAGTFALDPIHGSVMSKDGTPVTFASPTADALPDRGFSDLGSGLTPPPTDPETVSVEIRPGSDRLQALTPFPPFDPTHYVRMPILLKATGKCTTDHISPAGPWLKYRGHLENISNNLFSGAHNAFGSKPGHGLNVLTGETDVPLHELAKAYKLKGQLWVAIGDANYGEGSSREHAAMSPRFLGGGAVIARSFARIHETNLKKQGILPLTFAQRSEYDLIEALDRVTLEAIDRIEPQRPVKALILKKDGGSLTISLNHSMTEEQIAWFKAGGALNLIRHKQATA